MHTSNMNLNHSVCERSARQNSRDCCFVTNLEHNAKMLRGMKCAWWSVMLACFWYGVMICGVFVCMKGETRPQPASTSHTVLHVILCFLMRAHKLTERFAFFFAPPSVSSITSNVRLSVSGSYGANQENSKQSKCLLDKQLLIFRKIIDVGSALFCCCFLLFFTKFFT